MWQTNWRSPSLGSGAGMRHRFDTLSCGRSTPLRQPRRTAMTAEDDVTPRVECRLALNCTRSVGAATTHIDCRPDLHGSRSSRPRQSRSSLRSTMRSLAACGRPANTLGQSTWAHKAHMPCPQTATLRYSAPVPKTTAVLRFRTTARREKERVRVGVESGCAPGLDRRE